MPFFFAYNKQACLLPPAFTVCLPYLHVLPRAFPLLLLLCSVHVKDRHQILKLALRGSRRVQGWPSGEDVDDPWNCSIFWNDQPAGTRRFGSWGPSDREVGDAWNWTFWWDQPAGPRRFQTWPRCEDVHDAWVGNSDVETSQPVCFYPFSRVHFSSFPRRVIKLQVWGLFLLDVCIMYTQ